MRKHKSVVAILLAVMMIFTFMPAMAFAYSTGTGVDWGDDFKVLKVTSAGTTKTYEDVRFTESNGVITATAWESGLATSYQAKFYDLTNAKVYVTFNGGRTRELAGNWEDAQYRKLFDDSVTKAFTVELAKSSYITGSTWTGANLTTLVTSVKGSAAEKTTAGDTFNLGFNMSYSDADGNNYPFLIGPDLAATIKISDGSVATKNVWYVDTFDKAGIAAAGTDGANLNSLVYDGKEHTIGYNAGDYAVSYEKKDTSRGVWVAASAPTVKDVKKYGQYRAVYKDSSNNTQFVTLSNEIEVVAGTKKPNFDFKPGAMRYGTVNYDYDVTAEEAAAPEKFVVLVTGSFNADDQDALMNYFNDFYKMDVVKDATNENLQTWRIATRYDATKDAATITELNKKYATLLVNYGMAAYNAKGELIPPAGSSAIQMFTAAMTASDYMVAKVPSSAEINTKNDDITFSGVTTKSFKAKKKTKKLAKAKNFQVVAKADSGNVITFSATSSNGKVSIDETGVVTVKKGLKKGAKVKLVVKAKTAAGNGYKAASAEKTYTIKIK